MGSSANLCIAALGAAPKHRSQAHAPTCRLRRRSCGRCASSSSAASACCVESPGVSPGVPPLPSASARSSAMGVPSAALPRGGVCHDSRRAAAAAAAPAASGAADVETVALIRSRRPAPAPLRSCFSRRSTDSASRSHSSKSEQPTGSSTSRPRACASCAVRRGGVRRQARRRRAREWPGWAAGGTAAAAAAETERGLSHVHGIALERRSPDSSAGGAGDVSRQRTVGPTYLQHILQQRAPVVDQLLRHA